MHRNSQRVKTCLFSTGAKKSNFDAMPPSEIGKVFAKLRQNPKQTFLLDGGTGEELFRRKVPDDREIWSATALVHPQFHGILEDVHTSFLQSGSNAITTNSYGVVPGVGFEEDEISLYMEQSGKIARSAITKHTNESPSFVFGSLGPLIESYRPDMILAHDEGVKGYKVAYKSLAPYVDAFLAETMSCVDESIQVLDALASSSDVEPGERPSLLISYSVDSEGNFRDGEKLIDGIRRIIEETNEKKEKIQRKVFFVHGNTKTVACWYCLTCEAILNLQSSPFYSTALNPRRLVELSKEYMAIRISFWSWRAVKFYWVPMRIR